MRSGRFLTWKRNSNYEPIIKSTQNESARRVTRLLIRCTHVYNIPGTSTQISPSNREKTRSVHELLTSRTLRYQMPVVAECKKCCGSHHTLLHLDTGKATRETVPKIANVDSSKKHLKGSIATFRTETEGAYCSSLVKSLFKVPTVLQCRQEHCWILDPRHLSSLKH